jgi:hypothetical protein
MSGTGGMHYGVDAAHAAMVRDAIAEGIAAMQPLRQASVDIGGAFRQFDLDRANGELLALAQNLGSLLVLTETVSSVIAAPAKGQSPSAARSGSLQSINRCVEGLLGARSAGDWIQVADLLEHDVPVMLDRWKALLVSWQDEITPSSSGR